MDEHGRLRSSIDVVAGLLPGEPMEEYTRRFSISEEEWDSQGPDALGALIGRANYYALTLIHPETVNWVRFEWVWV